MLSGKHIVVIDDTESIRQFLRISLEAHGAVAHVAATAAGGLALCEQNVPDLVVLDIGLPDSEGLNILSRIKRLTRGRHSPAVVVLTVRKDQKCIERAKSLGADAYLIKPCFVEDVIEVIRNLLDTRTAPYLSLAAPENVPALKGEEDILFIKGAS